MGRPGGPRAMLQGFGSMGGATARYLAASGVVVVGVCDALGVVANPAGLDVERLLLTGTRSAVSTAPSCGPATGSSRSTDGSVSTPRS